jgi:hypothetical protein
MGPATRKHNAQYSKRVIHYVDTAREDQNGVNDKSLFLAAKDLIRQADSSNPGSVTDVLIHMVYCLSS